MAAVRAHGSGLLLGAFFVSGAAGLVAEVCWIRRATLAFGSTAQAFSTVLAVFFLGLAAGAVLFGERSRRIERPVRVYALLELALAALVLASLPLFDFAESLYGRVYRAAEAPGAAVYATRVGLVALVLLAPTVLMGGTLPLLCRQLVGSRERLGRSVGFLYGINTLGAACGAALCGLLLLPELGTRLALGLAAAADVAAAGMAAAWGWRRVAAAHVPAGEPEEFRARQTSRPRQRVNRRTAGGPPAVPAGVVAMVFLASGFVALGNEVLWTRFLALVVRTTVLTYTLCLTVTLLGIAIGSWLAAAVVDRSLSRARVLGAVQVAGGLSVLVITLLPPALWRGADAIWVYVLLLLLPAVLSGATFPLVVRMVVDDPALAAASVGRMTAINTLGGIAGSLLVGFVVLPRLGLQGGLYVTTGVALASGLAVWWMLDRQWSGLTRAALTLGCGLAWIALPRLIDTRLPQDFLAARAELVDFREGRESNLAVIRRPEALVLEADRWWQGQDHKTHQVLAAHVPLLLHPNPRRVLMVGVGAGQTPASALLYDIAQLDCVDIEPAVFDLVGARFAGGWMRDPRVRLLPEDGRSYVAHSAARYDVIGLEVGQIFRPGVASFYTVEFYRQLRDRLEPGGIVAQFVPLPFLSEASLRSVLATFLEVFPQSILWYNTAELLLLGTTAERWALPTERLELLAASPGVHADLRYSQWGGPAYWLNTPGVFLGGFLMGPGALAALAAGAPIERDDRPVLAYASRGAGELEARELATLGIIRPHLEPVAGILNGTLSAATLAAAATARERNLGDITAAALLRQVDALVATGEYNSLSALLDDARRANPESVRARRLAGDLALFQGQPAAAQGHYAAALALDPDDVMAHFGMARALVLQRRAAAAVAHYRVWLAAHPDDAEAHNGLAAGLAEQGDLDGAQTHFEAAVRLRPGFTEASANLARLRASRNSTSPQPR